MPAMIHSPNGILYKEKVVKYSYMDESLKHFVEGKSKSRRRYMYDTIFIKSETGKIK